VWRSRNTPRQRTDLIRTSWKRDASNGLTVTKNTQEPRADGPFLLTIPKEYRDDNAMFDLKSAFPSYRRGPWAARSSARARLLVWALLVGLGLASTASALTPGPPGRPVAHLVTPIDRGAPCRLVEATAVVPGGWRCPGAASGYIPWLVPVQNDDMLAFRLEGRLPRSTRFIALDGIGRLRGPLRWYWRPGQGEFPPAFVVARFGDPDGATGLSLLIALRGQTACVAALAGPGDAGMLDARAFAWASLGRDGFRCETDEPEILGEPTPRLIEARDTLGELSRVERINAPPR
jgi:hypothetical protein